MEEEVLEEWLEEGPRMRELLTERIGGTGEDLLVDEERTGSSSSTSCGVRKMAVEVETSPRMSERT